MKGIGEQTYKLEKKHRQAMNDFIRTQNEQDSVKQINKEKAETRNKVIDGGTHEWAKGRGKKKHAIPTPIPITTNKQTKGEIRQNGPHISSLR